MKKFNICLVILIIFGGFVFFTGWTQFKVDADKCGILISKTNGICQEPIIPGEFNWHWQFLLPTNTKIKQFSIEPVNTVKTIKGQLPSGDVYTSIYSSTDSFSYYFDFSMAVTISAQNIISLLERNIISNEEDLKEYLNTASESIAQLAADYYLTKAKENQDFNLEKIRRDDVIRSIQFYKEYPEVELSAFALTSSKVPDFNLYRKIQSQILTSSSLSTNTTTENITTEENANE